MARSLASCFKAFLESLAVVASVVVMACRNPFLAGAIVRAMMDRSTPTYAETPYGRQSFATVLQNGKNNTKYKTAIQEGTIPALWTYSDLPTSRKLRIFYKGKWRRVRGTCHRTCKGCYAEKMLRGPKAKAIGISWARHTYCIENYLIPMFVGIAKRLSTLPDGAIIRLYASGDFPNQNVIDAWELMARLFPRLKFFGYSKMGDVLDFSRLQALPNANVVLGWVLDPCTGKRRVNFGEEDFMRKFCKATGCHLCLCDAKGGDKSICMRTCFACLYMQNVCFCYH